MREALDELLLRDEEDHEHRHDGHRRRGELGVPRLKLVAHFLSGAVTQSAALAVPTVA